MADITITLTEDEARTIAKGDGITDYPFASLREKARAALPTEYPDGTIAWVTSTTAHTYLSVRDGGRWRHGLGGGVTLLDPSVSRVEPIRVLADDEIAVKRRQGITAMVWRNFAKDHRDEGLNATADLCEAYADALEAEARS